MAVHINNDGSRILVGRGDAVILFSAGGETIRHWPGGVVTDVAISGDGERVVAGHVDGRILVWRVSDGAIEAELRGHDERISTVEIRGEILVSSSWDNTVRLWGLGVLRDPPERLLAEITRDWGLSLDDALTGTGP